MRSTAGIHADLVSELPYGFALGFVMGEREVRDDFQVHGYALHELKGRDGEGMAEGEGVNRFILQKDQQSTCWSEIIMFETVAECGFCDNSFC